MLAVNHIGAVYVPVNVAYRRRLLDHIPRLSDARLMVAHTDLVSRLQEVGRLGRRARRRSSRHTVPKRCLRAIASCRRWSARSSRRTP